MDSSTNMAEPRALSRETSSRIPDSSFEMVHIWASGANRDVHMCKRRSNNGSCRRALFSVTRLNLLSSL